MQDSGSVAHGRLAWRDGGGSCVCLRVTEAPAHLLIRVRVPPSLRTASVSTTSRGRAPRLPVCLLVALLLAPPSQGNLPLIDLSTQMRALLVPSDAPVGSVVYRVLATDSDTRCDYPLHFDITSAPAEGSDPVLRAEDVPCTCADKACRANVVLARPLEAGRVYELRLRVRDTTGDATTVPSSVRATNATTPLQTIFPHVPTLVMVPEDTKPGTAIEYVLVTNHPKWKIHPVLEIWGSPLFSLGNTSLESASTIRADIILAGELDFEKQTMYMLTVMAMNAYADPELDTRNVATASVAVAVLDVQDSPPYFTHAPPLTRLTSAVKQGDAVVRVQAEDGDRGQPREMRYGLVSEGTPLISFFSVDERSGEVRLQKPLRELLSVTHAHQPIVLTVVAEEVKTDIQEPPALSATAEIALLLSPPENSPPYFETTRFVTRIPENSPQGTTLQFDDEYVTEIRDDDMGKYGVFSIFLSDNITFEVSPTVGEQRASFHLRVRNSEQLDYEQRHQLSFHIIAHQLGPDESLSSSAEVTVFLNDVNDNAPVFDKAEYQAVVMENISAGFLLTQVHASDVDTGIFGRVRYTHILGLHNSSLTLDPVSGVVLVATSNHGFDREAAPEFHLHVEATDMDGDERGNTANVPLIIHVLDVNDNAPVFEKDIYEFVLRQDLSDFTTRAQVKALDGDAEAPNNVVHYSIDYNTQDATKFRIDKITGLLGLRESLSHEKPTPRLKRSSIQDASSPIEFFVEAHDMGSPQHHTRSLVRVYPPPSPTKMMQFIIPGPLPSDRADIEKLLSSMLRSSVRVCSVTPYDDHLELQEERMFARQELANKTLIIAEVQSSGDTVVDISKIASVFNTGGTVPKPELITTTAATSEVTKEAKAESNSLFWILIIMTILLLIVIIILILCCMCAGCPLYMSHRKHTQVASTDDHVQLVLHEEGRGKDTKAVQAELRVPTREAWSADMRQHQSWKFNRRNNTNRDQGEEDFHSFRSLPGPHVIYTRELQALQQQHQRAEHDKDVFVEDIEGGQLEGPRELRLKNDTDLDADSIRRHEMERGSDIGRGGADTLERQRVLRDRKMVGTQHLHNADFKKKEAAYSERANDHVRNPGDAAYHRSDPDHGTVHFSNAYNNTVYVHGQTNNFATDEVILRRINNSETSHHIPGDQQTSDPHQVNDLHGAHILVAADELDLRRLTETRIPEGYRLILERTSPQDDSDNKTPVGREQYFIQEGNAEILRLVTRGRSDEENISLQLQRPSTFLPATEQHIRIENGKEIIMQRFMQDQHNNTPQISSLQRDNIKMKKEMEEPTSRSTGEGNLSGSLQTVIAAHEVCLQTEQVNNGHREITRKGDITPQLHENDKHIQDDVRMRAGHILQPYSVLGGAISESQDTQSLPAQYSMATQTDVDIGTQTDPVPRRAISDNDDSFTEEEEDYVDYSSVVLIKKPGSGKGIRWVRRNESKKKNVKTEHQKKFKDGHHPRRVYVKTPIMEETESSLELAEQHTSAAQAPEDTAATSNYTENKSSMLRRQKIKSKILSNVSEQEPVTTERKKKKSEVLEHEEESLSDSLEEQSLSRDKDDENYKKDRRKHQSKQHFQRNSESSDEDHTPEKKEPNEHKASSKAKDKRGTGKKIEFDSDVRFYYRKSSSSVHSSPERWIQVKPNRPRSRSLSSHRATEEQSEGTDHELLDKLKRPGIKTEKSFKDNDAYNSGDAQMELSRTKSTSELQRIKKAESSASQQTVRAKSVMDKRPAPVTNSSQKLDVGGSAVRNSRYMDWYKTKKEERERKKKEEEEKKLNQTKKRKVKSTVTKHPDTKQISDTSQSKSTSEVEDKTTTPSLSHSENSDKINPQNPEENKSTTLKQNEVKPEDDLDSGIAMSSLSTQTQASATNKKRRHQELLEKKSVFAIAYNDVHTEQLRPDTSSPSY
ncbi:cadherin-86C-like [Schistocerca nitens]|uniref:cadherin-86C-like n=1 Tax=Schistocerca nitens TaxID=7011 RepID=UPI002117A4E4|nr:cadherin-86C-like [Schistocerca nitens]